MKKSIIIILILLTNITAFAKGIVIGVHTGNVQDYYTMFSYAIKNHLKKVVKVESANNMVLYYWN